MMCASGRPWWDELDPESICSRWKKAGQILLFDGSEDEARANEKLNADAPVRPLTKDGDVATACGQEVGAWEGGGPSLEMADFFEVLEIDDDNSTREGDDDDNDPVVEIVTDSSEADHVACSK